VATSIVEAALREMAESGTTSHRALGDLGDLFDQLGPWEEFEDYVARSIPDHIVQNIRDSLRLRR
jgi:hypothetical protein